MQWILFLLAAGIASAYTGRDISANIFFCGAIIVIALTEQKMPLTIKRLAYIAGFFMIIYVSCGPSFVPPKGW